MNWSLGVNPGAAVSKPVRRYATVDGGLVRPLGHHGLPEFQPKDGLFYVGTSVIRMQYLTTRTNGPRAMAAAPSRRRRRRTRKLHQGPRLPDGQLRWRHALTEGGHGSVDDGRRLLFGGTAREISSPTIPSTGDLAGTPARGEPVNAPITFMLDGRNVVVGAELCTRLRWPGDPQRERH